MATDRRGRTVWTDPIEEVELELMTTQELRLALKAANDDDREKIRSLADSDQAGVVARNRTTGLYDIISDADLQSLMESDKELQAEIRRRETVSEVSAADDDQSLSLVSTQALKVMLGGDAPQDAPAEPDDISGFDPYNKG